MKFGLKSVKYQVVDKMVTMAIFVYEVSSCVNNNAIPYLNCNFLLLWHKLYDLICLGEVDGWCVWYGKCDACCVMWNWMANYCYMNSMSNYYYMGCMNCYTVVPDEILTSLYVNNLSILFILLYFVIMWYVATYRMIICCKLQIEKGLWINL